MAVRFVLVVGVLSCCLKFVEILEGRSSLRLKDQAHPRNMAEEVANTLR